jgi:hypothetical protein
VLAQFTTKEKSQTGKNSFSVLACLAPLACQLSRYQNCGGICVSAVATALTMVISKQNVATQGHKRSKILLLLFSGIVLLTENSFLNEDLF